MLRRTGYCAKLRDEQQTSGDTVLKDNLQKMNLELRRALFDVSEKLKGQLRNLIPENRNIEENLPLQERVQKACGYFSEKLELIVSVRLKSLDVEIDNKVVRKSVNDSVAKLSDDVHLKLACLDGCKSGFLVKNYMEIRAKSAIEPAVAKQKFRSAVFSPDGLMPHPDLYKTIRTWRGNKADELNVDAYMILPQKTLLELVTHLPSTLSELKKVKGFGAKKLAQFGKEILPLIIEYRIHHKMELPAGQFDDEPEEPIKAPKVDTKLVS